MVYTEALCPLTGGERMCVCSVTFQKLPWSGLDFSSFCLLQHISRVQNHEGLCQETVLGQVKTEPQGNWGVWPYPSYWVLPSQTSQPLTSVPIEGKGRGEGKQNQSKCQPRKCPRAPNAL